MHLPQIQACTPCSRLPHNTVRQIKDSQPLRQLFVAEARGQPQRDDLIAGVTDMPFAAQRFDSLQKPLGRTMFSLEALLGYCHVVTQERGATPVEGARALGLPPLHHGPERDPAGHDG